MDKKNMIRIIRACEDLFEIDSVIKLITNENGIGYNYKGLWDLTLVIKDNCEVEEIDEILSILEDKDLDSEEKYELLMRR